MNKTISFCHDKKSPTNKISSQTKVSKSKIISPFDIISNKIEGSFQRKKQ